MLGALVGSELRKVRGSGFAGGGVWANAAAFAQVLALPSGYWPRLIGGGTVVRLVAHLAPGQVPSPQRRRQVRGLVSWVAALYPAPTRAQPSVAASGGLRWCVAWGGVRLCMGSSLPTPVNPTYDRGFFFPGGRGGLVARFGRRAASVGGRPASVGLAPLWRLGRAGVGAGRSRTPAVVRPWQPRPVRPGLRRPGPLGLSWVLGRGAGVAGAVTTGLRVYPSKPATAVHTRPASATVRQVGDLPTQAQVQFKPGLMTYWRAYRSGLGWLLGAGVRQRQWRVTRAVAQLRRVATFTYFRLLSLALGGVVTAAGLRWQGAATVNGCVVFSWGFQLRVGDVVVGLGGTTHPTPATRPWLEVDELGCSLAVLAAPAAGVGCGPQLPHLTVKLYNWKYAT